MIHIKQNNFQRDIYPDDTPISTGHTPSFGEWQLCPKCNGQGMVLIPPYVAGDATEWSSTTVCTHTCPVCNGAKIIQRPIIKP